MNLEQEKILVEKARYSAEAFGELYDMYYSQIFGYALRRSADVETAKDVTSSVFFKALASIDKYEWRGVPFSHWLYRIANREIIDHHKKQSWELRFETAGDLESANLRKETLDGMDNLKKHDDFLDIHRYVSELPAKYQEVLSLRYFEDLNIAEIARILEKREGTVKSLLHRGINRLRTLMNRQTEE